jgi:flagellar protein FlgJ
MSQLAIAQLSGAGITAEASAGNLARKPDDPARVRDAAQQFEALLMGQILRSVRESGKGWLNSGGEDASGDCATDFAEQQLATALAQGGGLGLTDVIAAGLTRKP